MFFVRNIATKKTKQDRSMMFAPLEPRATPPKLSYFSLPSIKHATAAPFSPGLATPPLRRPVAVPFLWEEAPGKPWKKLSLSHSGEGTSKSRMTVLDGPYNLRRPPGDWCHSFSAGDEKVLERILRAKRSINHDEQKSNSNKNKKKKKITVLGSWWKAKKSSSMVDTVPVSVVADLEKEGEEEEIEVKIRRFGRHRSFVGVSSSAASRFWAGIKGSFKQVVPWKRD